MHDPESPGAGTSARALADWPAELACLGVRSTLAAGTSLFLRGSVPRQVFWLETGEIQLQRASSEGRHVIVQRVRAGFVAEASLQAACYHCDAVAATASTVWRFPRNRVLAALRGSPELALWWAARLAEQLRRARLRIERLCLKGASDRVVHAIETDGADGTLALESTRRAWAAELGLTPEALYRTLAQLQRSGRLRIQRNTLTLATARGEPQPMPPRNSARERQAWTPIATERLRWI